MSFTNAQLATKIADLITYWSSFNEEYSNWVGGAVDGGPNSDGEYPLTNWAGEETLLPCPALLADDVTGYVATVAASAATATAAAAAAAASETAASGYADTATAQAVLADADRIAAAASAATATNEAVTAVAQAAAALASAAAALISETNAAASEAAAATSEAAAAASAAAAAASALLVDDTLFFKLADDEVVTGATTFKATTTLKTTSVADATTTSYKAPDFRQEGSVYYSGAEQTSNLIQRFTQTPTDAMVEWMFSDLSGSYGDDQKIFTFYTGEGSGYVSGIKIQAMGNQGWGGEIQINYQGNWKFLNLSGAPSQFAGLAFGNGHPTGYSQFWNVGGGYNADIRTHYNGKVWIQGGRPAAQYGTRAGHKGAETFKVNMQALFQSDPDDGTATSSKDLVPVVVEGRADQIADLQNWRIGSTVLASIGADGAFSIYDSLGTDSVEMSHDGTDFNFDFTNTTWVDYEGMTGVRYYGDAYMMGGSKLTMWDTTNADTLDLQHTGSHGQITTGGTGGGNVRLQAAGGYLELRTNTGLRFRDAANTLYGELTINSSNIRLRGFSGVGDLDIIDVTNVNVPALVSTGAVTGSNLNVSNWDTAYGWGDWAATVALKAPIASPTFTGVVTTDSAFRGVTARATTGADWTEISYAGLSGYRAATYVKNTKAAGVLVNQVAAGGSFLWYDDAYATKMSLSETGNLTGYGTIGGFTNLAISDWNTAFGWGDHASGGY